MRWPAPPPGPFRRDFWRSPLRGQWLTSLLGLVLLVGLPVMIVTGLASYAAYNPRLPGNDTTPGSGLFAFYLFDWPTSPDWLYRLNQGTHVLLGLALVPIVLAKLWSVAPKLFDWPPVRSLAQAVERLSLLLIVGGILFEIATGVADIQNWYIFGFSFYTAHFYGAWVFIAGFVAHIIVKIPAMRRGLRTRSLRRELRTPLAATEPEAPDPDDLAPLDPAPPTLSRRGLLGLVSGSSLVILALTIGQTVGGPLRRTALFGPRGRDLGNGPNDFQVNKTFAVVGIKRDKVDDSWRLELRGRTSVVLGRGELLAMPQHTERLPIACVEGWGTLQSWTGVRLVDLARMAGYPDGENVFVQSLQTTPGFGTASLSRDQVANPRSLLALKVNGADLSLDHGFPARVIVPAAPGVKCTKWVSRLDFRKA